MMDFHYIDEKKRISYKEYLEIMGIKAHGCLDRISYKKEIYDIKALKYK